MATPALKDRLRQASHFGGAVAAASPLGKILYVDSTAGVDGNDGLSEQHPLLTLTRAIALADAGDTIVCIPGGSETVTSTLAMATARVKVVCPVRNAASGFTITGAGTLALMTVSAADCHVEGLKFAHTGATSSTAKILTTNAADRLTVRRCLFDDTAIATTFTGFGVEVVNACDDVLIEDCTFLDCHRGVKFTIATGVTCARPRISGCTFFVGQATAFGICSALTGTGIVQGLVVSRCEFIEANGSGAAATAAWNGTNGTDATRGPIKFEAAVDQFLVTDCRAYTLANYSFQNQCVNSGAGDFVDCLTSATVVGSVDAIYSDTTAIHTQTTAIDSDITVIKSDTTAIHLQTTTIASDLVLMQAGYPVAFFATKLDTTIQNNTQAAGGIICTATGGHVLIDEVVLAKDSTALTGPTNLRLSTNNTYGDTGAADPVLAIAVASVTATTRIAGLGTAVWSTLKMPFVLESTKALYIHGDDAAGTSGGNYLICVRGRAQNSSTTLV